MKTVKLPEVLRVLLLMGVKQTGSYDPDLVLAYVGEQMTLSQNKAAEQFLTWCKTTATNFGHGNIDEVWAKWQKA